MGTADAHEWVQAGREFNAEEIGRTRETAAWLPGLARRELAATVCARENQLSRFGAVSLDGTKIHANASRHSALSYEHAEIIEAHLKSEVQELLAMNTIPTSRSVSANRPNCPPRRSRFNA